MTGEIFNIQEFLMSLMTALITSSFAENMLFSRAIGTNTVMIAAKNRRNLPGVCLCVTYMTAVTSLVTGLLRSFAVNIPMTEYYTPLIYVCVISAVYLVTLILARIIFGSAFGKMSKYVHISAFNATVMGTMFLSTRSCSGIFEYLMFGLGAGLGFTASAYLLSAVRSQLYSEKVPHVFRGYPAVMIFIGILAMAFYGVLGHTPSHL